MPFVGDSDPLVSRSAIGTGRSRSLTYRGKEEFVVPTGMRTDFASVPPRVRWFLPRYGRYTKAAILHDYLWRHRGRRRDRRGQPPRRDGLFRRVMRELDVPFLRRWIMWAASSGPPSRSPTDGSSGCSTRPASCS